MRLPNSERLQIDREKIVEYLLSATHPDGQAKAEFSAGLAFVVNIWEIRHCA
jgi:hypothetical protein